MLERPSETAIGMPISIMPIDHAEQNRDFHGSALPAIVWIAPDTGTRVRRLHLEFFHQLFDFVAGDDAIDTGR